MSLANKMSKANYQGDPGLFGDIWKGIKSVGRAATGIVGGLGIPIVSGVSRIAGATLFGGAPRNQIPGASTFPTMPPQATINQAGTWARPGVAQWGFNPPFGGAPGVGIGPYGIGEGQRAITGGQAGIGCPTGYHVNKTGYFTKSEGWIEPYSRCVRNRRRNPGNMKALSRSLGRIKSAKKMAAVLGTVSIRKTC